MLTIAEYTRSLFGEKAYRLSLDGGFTCPNRDGKIGFGGCSFCREGSGEFAEGSHPSLDTQIAMAKARISGKYHGNSFIAYFQSYTNTYAPVEQLRALFFPLLTRKEIVALSIATRPDCLPEDVLALLAEMNRIKPVWIELGLQTMHDSTAERLNRGYATSIYDGAITCLRKTGIHTVTHLILGLPGETEEMMLASANHIAHAGSDGLKIQMLNILRDTPLAREYALHPFPLLSMEEYARITARIIRRMPETMVLHRMTGDGAKKHLVAPEWVAEKKRVLNALNRELEKQS